MDRVSVIYIWDMREFKTWPEVQEWELTHDGTDYCFVLNSVVRLVGPRGNFPLGTLVNGALVPLPTPAKVYQPKRNLGWQVKPRRPE